MGRDIFKVRLPVWERRRSNRGLILLLVLDTVQKSPLALPIFSGCRYVVCGRECNNDKRLAFE